MTDVCLKNAMLDRPDVPVDHTTVRLPASLSALRPGDNLSEERSWH